MSLRAETAVGMAPGSERCGAGFDFEPVPALGVGVVQPGAAFAIWFVIQDVENPRVEASFLPEGQLANIEVAATNVDDLIPDESSSWR